MHTFKPKEIFWIQYNDNTHEVIVAVNDQANSSIPEEKYYKIMRRIDDVLREELGSIVKCDTLLDDWNEKTPLS